MRKKTFLLKNTINSILSLIDELDEGQVTLPNDIRLTKLFNISRSTVRVAVAELCDAGIIKREGAAKVVLRRPKKDDYYELE
ncbi:MAG: GntR family transcriptional regulator, partial [Paraglaciecola sp.]